MDNESINFEIEKYIETLKNVNILWKNKLNSCKKKQKEILN